MEENEDNSQHSGNEASSGHEEENEEEIEIEIFVAPKKKKFVDLSTLTKKELHEKCANLGITRYKSKNISQLKDLIHKKLGENTSEVVEPSKQKKQKKQLDTYTKDVLQENYQIHKNYVSQRKELSKKVGIKFRLPSIPEDISENIIKFIIHKNGDNTSTWQCGSGDLSSDVEGKQECKCFTSDGPISFTPSSSWDVIYFLDARDWINDNFALYKVNLKKNSLEWNSIKISKTQTFADQCQQGRRPRINWNSLLPLIQTHCVKIFEGTFQDIFTS